MSIWWNRGPSITAEDAKVNWGDQWRHFEFFPAKQHPNGIVLLAKYRAGAGSSSTLRYATHMHGEGEHYRPYWYPAEKVWNELLALPDLTGFVLPEPEFSLDEIHAGQTLVDR